MSSIIQCTDCDETIPHGTGFVCTLYGTYAIFCCEQHKARYEERMRQLAIARRGLWLGMAVFNGAD